MSGVRALLVDMDGTLVDTRAANYAAYAAALTEVGVTVDRAAFDGMAHGRNWRQFLPDLLSLSGCNADPARVAARKADLYPGLFDRIAVNAALVRLIETMRPACRAALVTTASRRNAEAVLRHHDLERLFDTVVSGDDVARHKPAPDAYRLAAERLAVTAAECLVIEDSDIGARSGAAFGADVLLVGIHVGA
jgi:HAD superfamily hydrolase (TIGR01509 family)